MQVFIPFYSRYGNCELLAKAVAQGVEEVEGVTAKLAFAPDTFTPPEIKNKDTRWVETEKRLAAEYPRPTLDDMFECDALIQGSPTRFGNMAAPLKMWWDAAAGPWAKGALIGKPGGCFTGSASVHGGQETTIVSMYFPMIHHGMIIVGIPYSEENLILTTKGGSPYGASVVVGQGSDEPPTEINLQLARALGKRVATIAKKLKS